MDAPVLHITCPKCGANVEGAQPGMKIQCAYCKAKLMMPRDPQGTVSIEAVNPAAVKQIVLVVVGITVVMIVLGVISAIGTTARTIRTVSDAQKQHDEAMKQANEAQKKANEMLDQERKNACIRGVEPLCKAECSPQKNSPSCLQTCTQREIAKCRLLDVSDGENG